MKKAIVFLFSLMLLASSDSSAESIYSLIKRGKLKDASDALSEISTAAIRDGNKLFFLSLLEEDADKSAQLMEASLQASVSPVYLEEIYFRLTQYYFIKSDYARLELLVKEYRTYWENGKYRKEMLRFSVIIDEKENRYEAALQKADRYLLEYNQGDARQWGLIDKARIMKSFNKKIATHNLLRKLSREKSGPGVGQALYMLAMEAVKKRKPDDVVFFYNILREGYPATVGLDAIVEKMANLSSTYEQDNIAEKITGTFYSVQVGVFSVKNNAKKQAKKFKKYSKKVEIKPKKISNMKYHVVYVGHFTNYNEANKLKRLLETKLNEVYQVVAR